jgi:flagellar motor switch protein FliG
MPSGGCSVDASRGVAPRTGGPKACGDAAVLARDGAEGRHYSASAPQGLGSTGRRGYAGFKAVADLLNRLDQVASKGILEEIEQNEPKLAIGIRTLMFTFEDLLTVPATSIRELVAAADKKTLSLALKGAKDNIKAHLFQAMSSRAVEMLKEDMEIMGPVRGRDVAEAQQELLNLARKLEAEGKMTLKVEADDDLAI